MYEYKNIKSINNLIFKNFIYCIYYMVLSSIQKEILKSENFNWEFIYLCQNGQLFLVKWLLEVKPFIDINFQNQLAFKSAVEHNKIEVVKWLIEIYSNIKLENYQEALEICKYYNYTNMKEYLLKIKQ